MNKQFGPFTQDPSTGVITAGGAMAAPAILDQARSKTQTAIESMGNIGYYRISGNIQDVAAAGSSELYMIVVAAEDEFEGFNVVFPPVAGVATSTPTVYAVKPVGSLAEAEAYTDLTTWIQQTSPAQPFVADIAAVRADMSGVTSITHWARSIARSDGGTKPLLAIIVGYASGQKRTLIKYALNSTAQDGWRSGAGNGGRILAGNYKTGYTQTWTTGTRQATFPIMGVNFHYRKPVLNILRVGDSRADGNGASIYGRDGCVVGQIDNVVAAYGGGILVGDMNLSQPGITNDVTFPGITQYLASSGIAPEFAFIQLYSINSISPVVVTTQSAMASALQGYRSILIRALRKLGTRTILYNTNPCTTAVKDLTLSDYLRVENNTRFAGAVDLDWASHASGANVGGQIQPLAGATLDGIHESDAELAWQGTQLLTKLKP